ncbi:hypothetical protein QBC41DRAFT_319331 [Cercophora samala]|uniref:Uncharacterized protein n=1 Tax=Cercophora samala TaxID=330535 RepID=A0AA39ZEP2_9PEZI|nr:hypothetical protein QBC41DRAFT_319331 [Cercophora samala]
MASSLIEIITDLNNEIKAQETVFLKDPELASDVHKWQYYEEWAWYWHKFSQDTLDRLKKSKTLENNKQDTGPDPLVAQLQQKIKSQDERIEQLQDLVNKFGPALSALKTAVDDSVLTLKRIAGNTAISTAATAAFTAPPIDNQPSTPTTTATSSPIATPTTSTASTPALSPRTATASSTSLIPSFTLTTSAITTVAGMTATPITIPINIPITIPITTSTTSTTSTPTPAPTSTPTSTPASNPNSTPTSTLDSNLNSTPTSTPDSAFSPTPASTSTITPASNNHQSPPETTPPSPTTSSSSPSSSSSSAKPETNPKQQQQRSTKNYEYPVTCVWCSENFATVAECRAHIANTRWCNDRQRSSRCN